VQGVTIASYDIASLLHFPLENGIGRPFVLHTTSLICLLDKPLLPALQGLFEEEERSEP
jgi:hypothetical protein